MCHVMELVHSLHCKCKIITHSFFHYYSLAADAFTGRYLTSNETTPCVQTSTSEDKSIFSERLLTVNWVYKAEKFEAKVSVN